MKNKKTIIILSIVCGVCLIASLFLGIRYLINEKFISDYKQEAYEGLNEDGLFTLNFPQSYIPYYNSGNAAYQNKEYEEAEEYYMDALKQNPPHNEDDDYECNIRINLALSMLQQIDYNGLDSEDAIEKAIDQLTEARNVLTETGCANPNDANGHNEDAEQLKKEIDDLIEKLQNPTGSGGSGDSDSDSSNSNDSDSNSDDSSSQSDREQQIRDQLEQERKDAYESGRDYQQNNSGYGDEDYGYSGDKW